MTKGKRNHIEQVVKGAYELKAADLVWKPLYPNNIKGGKIDGIYCLVLQENEDGTFAGRKYTIYYQQPLTVDGSIDSETRPELYILFEKCYKNLVNKEHPEPSNKFISVLNEITENRDFRERLDNIEVNDYGSFHRAYANIEDAKKQALLCYKAVFGYAMSHMLL